jgi:OHCU decarboxylase
MPLDAPLRLEVLNALGEDAFVSAFSGIFEHSPWVAEMASRRRPFQTVADVRLAFDEALRDAGSELQLALIRAHPELAGRSAAEGELTDESTREQASAGLNRLSPSDLERLTSLNAAYGERFGFPMVFCVREHTTSSILAAGEQRLEHTPEEEFETALREIAKIARLRLDDILADG